MFTKKRIIIITVVIIAIIIIGVSFRSNKINYISAQVTRGEIKQTVDATGSVESSQSIALNFRTVGRLQKLNVTSGTKVVAGQILAVLEAAALQSRVTDARSALLGAQANYNKLLSGATPEDLKISQINVDQKKQAELTAENNLTNLKLQAETALHNLKNTAIITLSNEIVNGKSALETVKNTLNNEDASDTLGVLNINTVNIARDSQATAKLSVTNSELIASTIFESSSNKQVLDGLDKVVTALIDVRNCLDNVFNVLENTIISNKLTQTKLDNLITDIQTSQTTISAARTNLQIAKTNWTDKQFYFQKQINQAEDNLKAAKNNLRLAKAQLSLKQADPQSYDIIASQSRVTKAQASLSLSLANLGDTIIRAPVKGTIIEVNRDLGEQTSLAQPVISMIGESALDIKINIPESDIAKVIIGQPVEITLDSFGDDVILHGKVIFIDPAETIVQDVVYYQVKVQFINITENIKPGMTANAIIVTQIKKDTLRLPLRALKQKNGNKYVEILVNGKLQEKIITTGLRGNDYIEILDGLKAEDKIITFIKEKK